MSNKQQNNIKPQLSLFDNSNCTQCNTPIEKGFVYCAQCEEIWKEKYLNTDK